MIALQNSWPLKFASHLAGLLALDAAQTGSRGIAAILW
jgi:hypothetical protein